MPSTCRNRAQSSEIEHGSEIEHQEPNLGYDSKRNRGFKRCVTECTGHYSQTAARRSGFQKRARLAYRDFRFEGRAVFAEIEPPHTHAILFEREF
jgi:hypothetical protein